MPNNCTCIEPENIIHLILTKDGKEQARTVVARVCPTCGKHYLAPMSSLVFLLGKIRELTTKKIVGEFEAQIEKYLVDIPKKEE